MSQKMKKKIKFELPFLTKEAAELIASFIESVDFEENIPEDYLCCPEGQDFANIIADVFRNSYGIKSKHIGVE